MTFHRNTHVGTSWGRNVPQSRGKDRDDKSQQELVFHRNMLEIMDGARCGGLHDTELANICLTSPHEKIHSTPADSRPLNKYALQA